MVLTKLSEAAQVLDPGNEAFNLGIRRCRRTLRELLPNNVFQVAGLVICAFATKWKVNVNRFITASNNTINVLQSMTMEEVSVISKGR